MAFSYKTAREYQGRRERGYKTTKFPKGYDRWGMPIICGLIDADGNESLTRPRATGCAMSTRRSGIASWAGSATAPSSSRRGQHEHG